MGCGWFVHVRTMVRGFEAAHKAQDDMYKQLIDALTDELQKANWVGRT